MYVGVIPSSWTSVCLTCCIPHVRGGDPRIEKGTRKVSRYSPCTWGWSCIFYAWQGWSIVFPMYVGVIPFSSYQGLTSRSIPHVCGGDPILESAGPAFPPYSPCKWGWSRTNYLAGRSAAVFPMYVGGSHIRRAKLSHFSYGMLYNTTINFWYSPCVWGWSWNDIQWDGYPSVFPILVGAIYY